MRNLSFDVKLTWSGAGHEGAGRIQTDDVALDLSGPESMGGRGVGTNPEKPLVCAVSSCYTATLFAVLCRAQLPIVSLTVTARGTATGFPAATRFTRIVVTPTVRGRRRLSARIRGRCLSGARSLPHRPYACPRGRLSARARRPSLAPTADAPRCTPDGLWRADADRRRGETSG
jgi:peroxiredoxin-like protein